MQLTAPTKASFQQYLLRRLVQVLVLVCTIAVAWVSAPLGATKPSTTHAESTATEAVKSTVAELIQVLDDPRLKEPERAEQRRDEIERIVRHRVSYEEMAKRALGTRWFEINEHDRQEFVGLFVQLVWDAFASRINEHAGEQIVYLGEQRKDHFTEVSAQVKGQKVDTRIDFRLMQVSGDWLVYDVVIDGASIVSNYRAQFTTIIRDVTYVGLVKKIRQNAAAVKVIEKTTPR